MNRANLLSRVVAGGVIAGSMLLVNPAVGYQSSGHAESSQRPNSESSTNPETHSWTTEQAVTSSVRQAWALGGRTEQGFFQIVKALAELSAQKRGITLPDDQEAGKRAGDWIKAEAKKDPDQLLYVIVDRAVQYSARKQAGQQ
jgi:hypothetical protein